MTIHITPLPTNDRLGRHVEHDDRSRQHPFTATRPTQDKTVVWPTAAPCLNQARLGACTGFATAQLINTVAFTPTRAHVNHNSNYLTAKDAREIYSLATHLDNIKGQWPPTDGGSTGLAAAKAGTRLGYFTGYQHAFGFDHFRAAIAAQPVIVGTLWTKTMFTPNTDGVLHVGPLTDDNIAGGHEYLARGISYERRQVLFRNSWGPQWGTTGPDSTPGGFWVGFDDFEALLAQQGDVTVPHGEGQA